MKDMTVNGFCRKFPEDKSFCNWARGTGTRMMSELWDRRDISSENLVSIFSQNGVFSEEEHRIFCVLCSSLSSELSNHDGCIAALNAALRFASGIPYRESEWMISNWEKIVADSCFRSIFGTASHSARWSIRHSLSIPLDSYSIRAAVFRSEEALVLNGSESWESISRKTKKQLSRLFDNPFK